MPIVTPVSNLKKEGLDIVILNHEPDLPREMKNQKEEEVKRILFDVFSKYIAH